VELDAAQRLCCRQDERAMAILWFVHTEAMYGCPVYDFAGADIIRKLGGEASFYFLGRLDQAPERARGHDRNHVAPYDRVLLELPADEARSVRWRSGFYVVQNTPAEVVVI
jgi:hypothetical protein